MSDPVDSRPASGQPVDDAGVNDAGRRRRRPPAAVRPHVGHRADHRQHRRRRHLQPADLARGLRSDQPRLDGAHDRRCAGAGRAVRGAVAAAAGRRRPVRVRAGRVRQRVGFANAWSYWITAWAGNAAIAVGWVLYVEDFVNTGHNPVFSVAARAGRAVDPRGDQPVRRQEHGLGPGRDDDPEVRRAGCSWRRSACSSSSARTSRRGTSAARARSSRSAAAWRSPCSATSASRPPPSRPPR